MTETFGGRLRAALLSRRNLRRRLALAAGALTIVMVLVFSVATWLLVARSLQAATDDDLRTTVAAIERLGPDRLVDFDSSPEFDDVFEGDERPPVPYTQVLAPNGIVLVGEGLPVSEGAMAVARGEQDEHTETVEVNDRTIRVLTAPAEVAPVSVTVQIGSDVTNTVDGLRQARLATLVTGVMAGLITAGLAWLLGGRLVEPVSAVAAAADQLRRNDELPDRLEGEGEDELGRLVVSFNHLLDDLQQSRERQRRLVADASHELRTPLTSLRVKTEFIHANPDLASEQRQQMLDGAVADLGSLTDLVSELVELAAEGASPERSRLIDLGELVETEVARFRATSGRTVEVSTTPGVVETRPKQATRALTNLLVNADKYSPDGEPIVVTQVGPRIEVRDRGPGIPLEDRDRVFDRFFRGKGHQSIEGSGLGLAIVESMARANGGTVWVDDPGDGGPGAVVGFSAGPTPMHA
ncbi:MAG: HAMP domain-containing sensor histidine kinase [Actinomycetota bacterium]